VVFGRLLWWRKIKSLGGPATSFLVEMGSGRRL
jgi:hypothetical protein